MTAKQQKMAAAALHYAIEAAGGAAQLADQLKISKAAISQWQVCPPGRVLELETISNVRREDLRPDYYPSTPTQDQK